MKRSRFTIAALLGLVTLVGAGCAALTHPTPLWASTLFTLLVGLLCWTSVAAALARGRRPYWVGASVFGWVHLVLNFGLFGMTPGLKPFPPPPPTLYEHAANLLDRALRPAPPIPSPADTFAGAAPGAGAGSMTGPIGPDRTPFYQITYCLLTMLVALVGGWIGWIAAPFGRSKGVGGAARASDS